MFQVFTSILSTLNIIDRSIFVAMSEQINGFRGIDASLFILIILVGIVIVMSVVVNKEYDITLQDTGADLDHSDSRDRRSDSTGDINFDKIVKDAGYGYDSNQDIFYSRIDSWQRKYGYCKLYDEAAAPLGMIIDCEPIYFEYEGEKWLIEFWKGQYDLTTGGEIGLYKAKKSNIEIPGIFFGDFYEAVSNDELLYMEYELKNKDNIILTRADKHWWLTGFKLGDFFNPSDLIMDLEIEFNDKIMQNAFIKGLKEAGYLEEEIKVRGNSVGIYFDKPHTKQPYTRGEITDKIIQKKNKLLCDKYQEITKPYNNFRDKLLAVKTMAPELYNETMKIGKTKSLFEKYNEIKRYIG